MRAPAFLVEALGLPESADRPFGLLAQFATVDGLRAACEKVRDAGYTRFDAHSSIPIHGIDEAMGIRMSPIPWVAFLGALVGIAGAVGLQWWTNAIEYPLIISNKPLFSWAPAFPIIFECGVLLAAVGSVAALWVICGWPRLYHPLFHNERFRRMTTDAFFISIETRDPKFDSSATRALLEGCGATAVEEVSG